MNSARDYCAQVLPAVSRTFAVGVRCLGGVLRQTVGNAYLICRIADTIEDDPRLQREVKDHLFDLLVAALKSSHNVSAFVEGARIVSGDAAHVDLVHQGSQVFEVFFSLPQRHRAIVGHWAQEMILGMKDFCHKYPSGLRIQTLSEYKKYCYFVAGTVGHMLTELWHDHFADGIAGRLSHMSARAEAFGEALQTVNIIKDIAWDALHENNCYIPQESLARQGSSHDQLLNPEYTEQNAKAVNDLIDLATQDLARALEYVCYLPRHAYGIRLFTGMPLVFAYATLRELRRDRRMWDPHVKVKISRGEVKSLVLGCRALGWSNTGLSWLCRRASTVPS